MVNADGFVRAVAGLPLEDADDWENDWAFSTLYALIAEAREATTAGTGEHDGIPAD